MALSQLYNSRVVAEQLGCKQRTVQEWRKRAREEPEFRRMVDQAVEELRREYLLISRGSVQRAAELLPGIPDALQAARVADIATRNYLLLSGQATQITTVRAELTDEERQARILAILEQAAQAAAQVDAGEAQALPAGDCYEGSVEDGPELRLTAEGEWVPVEP